MLDDNLYPILSSGDSIGALLASDPVSLNCGRAVRCSSQCSHASTVFKVKTMVAMVMVVVMVMVVMMVVMAMMVVVMVDGDKKNYSEDYKVGYGDLIRS